MLIQIRATTSLSLKGQKNTPTFNSWGVFTHLSQLSTNQCHIGLVDSHSKNLLNIN